MRDDVNIILEQLISLYNKKLAYIQKLLLNESDKLHYLSQDNIERIRSIIDEDAGLIDSVKLCDFEISRLIDNLAGITGVDRYELFAVLDKKNLPLQEIDRLEKKIRKAAHELASQRDIFISRLETAASGIRNTIGDISNIISIHHWKKGGEE